MMTYWKQTFIMAAMLSLMAIPVAAGEEFVPVQTLVLETSETLDFAPDKIVLHDNLVYILGTNPAGVGTVELRDAENLSTIRSLTLEMAVDDITVDPRGVAVYIIGNNGKNSIIEVLDLKLNRIADYALGNRLGYPVLSVSNEGLLTVGAMRTSYSKGFFGLFDVKNPAELQTLRDIQVAEAWRGVTGAWFDERNSTLFINTSWDARLLAINVQKEFVLSEFSEQSASKGFRDSYAVVPRLENSACQGNFGTSFLIADMTREVLSLVDYNEGFQSLETQAFVEFILGRTRALAAILPDTDTRQSVGLIAASCDQSVILLGSRISFDVAQFARNVRLSTLERVGTIDLRFLATDIDVSADGSFALAISQKDRRLVRLSPNLDDGVTRIIGDPDIRQLQRILTEVGYPVGSIDGIIGANTMRAIALAERKYDVELDITNDLLTTIETLSEVLR